MCITRCFRPLSRSGPNPCKDAALRPLMWPGADYSFQPQKQLQTSVPLFRRHHSAHTCLANMVSSHLPSIIPYADDSPPGPQSPPAPGVTPSRQFPSYTDYIDFLSQTLPPTRCFNWLYAFLTNYPDPQVPLANRPSTRILIADAVDSGWRISRTVNRQILGDHTGVNARIIVIGCEIVSWIDRDIVDELALFYDLNPIYLWGVFSRNRVDIDYHIVPLFLLAPVPFDSPDYDGAGISALELMHTNQRNEDQITFNLPSMSGIVVQGGPDKVPTGMSTLFSICPHPALITLTKCTDGHRDSRHNLQRERR